MANCPVDSMKTGGLSWFSDLTVPDPYYILPVLTSVTLFIQFYLGVEYGTKLAQSKGAAKVICGDLLTTTDCLQSHLSEFSPTHCANFDLKTTFHVGSTAFYHRC